MKKLKVFDIDTPGPAITWLVNQRCNFRCCYCATSTQTLSTNHPGYTKYDISSIIEKFDRSANNWKILLTGGEPFLYPHFIQLCSGLTKNHCISILTNLSTSNINEFADLIDPGKVYVICASLHILEREKNQDAVMRFVESVQNLQNRGFSVRVEYVMYPTLFKRVLKDREFFLKNGIHSFNIKAFRGYYQTKYYPLAYTNEQLNLIRDIAIDEQEISLINKTFTFFGHCCNAGTNFFTMNPGGDVKRCTTSMTHMGNLFEGTFQPNKTPHACPFLRCGCAYEGIDNVTAQYSSFLDIAKEVATHIPTYLSKRYNPNNIINFMYRRFFKGRKED